jgi:hypothetical protein
MTLVKVELNPVRLPEKSSQGLMYTKGRALPSAADSFNRRSGFQPDIVEGPAG